MTWVVDLLDEDLVAHHRQGEAKELPVGLLTLLEHLGGDLESGRCLGAGRDAGYVDGGVLAVIVVLEDGLVLGVPEGHRPLHVPATQTTLVAMMCNTKAT